MKLFRSSRSKSTTTTSSSSSSSSINLQKSDDTKTTLLPTKEKLHTHIEVCARIRPLQIVTTGRDSGYFSNTNRSSTRRKFGIKQHHQQKQQHFSSSPSAESTTASEFVAWAVNDDGDTAGQSSKTELIQGRTHSYTLDKVYDTQASTRDVYDNSIHSLVSAAMEGYHSSILAYGQTSTGKTFTMTGTKESPGLIPLCIRDCFRYVKECQESREYLIRVSYLEIYKENIRDLLSPTNVPIRLFDGPNGLIIKGLKEEIVTSPEKVFSILKEGEARRQVGATHMNQHSSRSHVMVRLWIESSPGVKKGRNKEKGSQSRVSSLSLVDLAGSESVRLNGTDRREEGHYINKSLMTLGQVVLSLSENKTGHIPYRDSKLTRLLQPSLSGNAQMVLLCCIHPHPSHLEESHNTFKFAARTKKIKQKAVINTAPDEKTLLQNYRDEIEDLKQQLAEAKQKQQQYLEEKETAASAAVVSNTSIVPNNGDDVVGSSAAASEIKELVHAIKTMEKLILKSHPHALSLPSTPTTTKSSSSLSIDIDDEEIDLLLDDDDEKDDLDLLLEDDDPLNTSTTTEGGDLIQSELSRIRGLLDTVLTKRSVGGGSSVAPQSPTTPHSTMSPSLNGVRAKRLDFSTPPSQAAILQDGGSSSSSRRVGGEQNDNKEEVLSLRKQLEQQELASNLRKADSSFLQTQLKEKDELLVEVSRVLEAVETRQAELEKENAELRLELDLLKARFVVI